MNLNTKFCQSCGMPLGDETLLGTNKDNSKNEEYCTYCYKNGEFTNEMTMKEMIEFCIPHMVQGNPNMSEQEARERMQQFFPTLKRWQ